VKAEVHVHVQPVPESPRTLDAWLLQSAEMVHATASGTSAGSVDVPILRFRMIWPQPSKEVMVNCLPSAVRDPMKVDGAKVGATAVDVASLYVTW
jgi:hypothetical protein